MVKSDELSLRDIQKECLNILRKIDVICRSNDIRYFLAYGTLIGAIRHKGFIPWDDDLDIWMYKKDVIRIQKIFEQNKEELYPLKFCTRENTLNYEYYIPRISNQEYKYVNISKRNISPDIGVFVDIYPLDNYCNSIEQGLNVEKRISNINKMFCAYVDGNSYSGGVNLLKKKLAHIIARMIYPHNYNEIVNKRIDNIIKKYTSDTDDYIGVLGWDTYKTPFCKTDFASTIEVEFEDSKFPVPIGYDVILKTMYGDYMQMPPEEKRKPTHLYKIYKRF